MTCVSFWEAKKSEHVNRVTACSPDLPSPDPQRTNAHLLAWLQAMCQKHDQLTALPPLFSGQIAFLQASSGGILCRKCRVPACYGRFPIISARAERRPESCRTQLDVPKNGIQSYKKLSYGKARILDFKKSQKKSTGKVKVKQKSNWKVKKKSKKRPKKVKKKFKHK